MSLIRNGILTRSGWFDYPDGPEYKCPKELKKAARIMPSMPLIAHHPEEMYASQASTVIGTGYNTYDVQEQAINTRYEFFEDRLTPEQLQAVKTRQIDVSPGFNTILKPYRHGHIQTDVLLNHGAVLFDGKGRCSVEQGCGVLDARVDRRGPAEPISPPKSNEIKPSSVNGGGVGEIIMTPESKTDTEACIKEKMDKGMSKEDAEKACAPKKEDTKTDDTTALEERITVLEKQLARSDALIKALEPMSEALRTSLAETKKFTADELKDKNYAELVWLKSKFDAPDTPQTVIPPSGLPDTKTLKVPPVGNKRYRYPEKLRSSE